MNIVYNKDCMVDLPKYPDNYFDLAVVDPPYGINITDSGRLGKYSHGHDWDKHIPTSDYFKNIFRISKNQIIWGGNYFNLGPCKCFLIWDKKQPFNLSFGMCEFAWTSFNITPKIFYQRANVENRIHTTQKPVKLYDWIFLHFSEPSFKIIDTHIGSGSSRIAAHKNKLSFIGYEIDKTIFEMQEYRFNKSKVIQSLF